MIAQLNVLYLPSYRSEVNILISNFFMRRVKGGNPFIGAARFSLLLLRFNDSVTRMLLYFRWRRWADAAGC